MKSAMHYFLVVVAGGALSASLLAQGIQYDKIEIKTEKVAPNLYMLSGSENVDPGHPDGAGGRIGWLAGGRPPLDGAAEPAPPFRAGASPSVVH